MEQFCAIPKMKIGDVVYVIREFTIRRGVISGIDISIHHDKKKTSSECRYDILLDICKQSGALFTAQESYVYGSLTEAAINILKGYDIVAEKNEREKNGITIIED